MRNKWKRMIPLALFVVLAAAFLIYIEMYYHAEPEAEEKLASNPLVNVERTDYGWFFDGPSEDDLFVFYPGGKVEETAYAPLLHLIAENGMDVCLVKMPMRLAVFGGNKANAVLSRMNYPHRYIGGHSLGGAMAASYAADHADKLDGLILLAAYPTKELPESLTVLSIYGSEDGVVNRNKLEEGKEYVTGPYWELMIEGGNHAMFGNYGMQDGDGQASISPEEQQKLTVDFILEHCAQ